MKTSEYLLICLALGCFAIGCGDIAPAKRNSDLYYRGWSAAALAMASVSSPEAPVIRPTPRETGTRASSTPEGSTPENSVPKDPPAAVETPPPVTPPEPPAVTPPGKPPADIEPPGRIVSDPPVTKFVPQDPPVEAKRQLWYFGGDWCGPCGPTQGEVSRFAQARGLILRNAGDPDAATADIVIHKLTPQFQLSSGQAPAVRLASCPALVLVDATGKEIQRIEGGCQFVQIENLFLSGPKRGHRLNGVPVNVPRLRSSARSGGLNIDWPKLIGTTKLTTTRVEDLVIPLPEVGELCIPKSVSVTALPWEGGTRVAVDSGTPCPYLRSRWLGNLYPVPITAVGVTPTRAIVELRGWKDVEIDLTGEGP